MLEIIQVLELVLKHRFRISTGAISITASGGSTGISSDSAKGIVSSISSRR